MSLFKSNILSIIVYIIINYTYASDFRESNSLTGTITYKHKNNENFIFNNDRNDRKRKSDNIPYKSIELRKQEFNRSNNIKYRTLTRNYNDIEASELEFDQAKLAVSGMFKPLIIEFEENIDVKNTFNDLQKTLEKILEVLETHEQQIDYKYFEDFKNSLNRCKVIIQDIGGKDKESRGLLLKSIDKIINDLKDMQYKIDNKNFFYAINNFDKDLREYVLNLYYGEDSEESKKSKLGCQNCGKNWVYSTKFLSEKVDECLLCGHEKFKQELEIDLDAHLYHLMKGKGSPEFVSFIYSLENREYNKKIKGNLEKIKSALIDIENIDSLDLDNLLKLINDVYQISKAENNNLVKFCNILHAYTYIFVQNDKLSNKKKKSIIAKLNKNMKSTSNSVDNRKLDYYSIISKKFLEIISTDDK